MADHEHFTKEQIIEAIRKSNGYKTVAGRMIGCTSVTIDNYMKKYPEIETVYNEVLDSKLDFAEGQLMKNIKEGKETSLIFFLKTKGKDRGYIERQEIQHPKSPGEPLTMKITFDEK